jgi:hypothetical protein
MPYNSLISYLPWKINCVVDYSTGPKSVILYEDDEHYFIKDLTTIGPIECHISSDREFILLRFLMHHIY